MRPLRNCMKTGNKNWDLHPNLISFAFGDNKVRGLDLLVADAMAQSAEVLVTGVEVQS